MDDDTIWMCDAPIHYCDLPLVAKEDDSAEADQYFFAKTSDDTVYYEPTGNEDAVVTPNWNQEIAPVAEEVLEYPVIRRRSRSVGSRPFNFRKPAEPPKKANPPIRRSAMPQLSTAKSVDDPDHFFVDGLRSYNSQEKRPHDAPKVTKPVPFNLTMPKKKITQSQSVNPSMAEGVEKWEKKTPDRFHSSRHGEVYRSLENRVELKTTEPHTPHLNAVKRHRPVHALSREALEEREVEEMKKNQFKAHGIDSKVFKTPILPPKKETKLTKVEPFHLTESHKKENIAPEVNEAESYHFHAKPAPKFEPPQAPEVKPLPVTVPQTPKFSEAGKASIYAWRRPRSRSNGSLTSSMRSNSSGGLPTNAERLKSTVVEPFSFESRDKMLQQRKEVKIKKMMEEERKQREFHAHPCPKFSHGSVSERPTLTTTRIAPFKLSCDTRGQSKKDKFIQQLEEMRLEERKAKEFKAQPAKILTKEPFKVKLDHGHNLTETAEFALSTAKRANERKEFDEWLKKLEQEKEANAAKREEERLKREAELAARLREETNFTANPIRHFKTIELKKTEIEITVPKTPKFMKK